MIDPDDLVYAGIEDLLNGVKSSSSDHYRGELYSKDIISLSELNGSESLFGLDVNLNHFVSWYIDNLTGIPASAEKAKTRGILEKSGGYLDGKFKLNGSKLDGLKSKMDSLLEVVNQMLDKMVGDTISLIKQNQFLLQYPSAKRNLINFSDKDGKEIEKKLIKLGSLIGDARKSLFNAKTPSDIQNDFYKKRMLDIWKYLTNDVYKAILRVDGSSIDDFFDETKVNTFYKSALSGIKDEQEKTKVLNALIKISKVLLYYDKCVTKFLKTTDSVYKTISNESFFDKK